MIKRTLALILVLVVILLATINFKPKEKQLYKIDKFYGLNCNGELELKKGESPDMANWRIADKNYKPKSAKAIQV